MTLMAKTKYQSVYRQPPRNGEQGYIYISVYLGLDPLTGKKIIKKARRDKNGNRFKTLRDAHLEAERIRDEYSKNGFSTQSGNVKLLDFYNKVFKPTYRGNVEESTWLSREPVLEMILN